MTPPLLRQTTFRRFWVGQSVSLIGDQVALFAVPITAVLALHAGASQMGLLTAAGLLPSLLFSLHAGVLVDRGAHRRRTMVVKDLARGALMASIPVSYALGRLGLPQLYAVTFCVGTFDVLLSVADASLFPLLVPRDSYVEGQALLNASRASPRLSGKASLAC
jgi:MFS family permease